MEPGNQPVYPNHRANEQLRKFWGNGRARTFLKEPPFTRTPPALMVCAGTAASNVAAGGIQNVFEKGLRFPGPTGPIRNQTTEKDSFLLHRL